MSLSLLGTRTGRTTEVLRVPVPPMGSGAGGLGAVTGPGAGRVESRRQGLGGGWAGSRCRGLLARGVVGRRVLGRAHQDMPGPRGLGVPVGRVRPPGQSLAPGQLHWEPGGALSCRVCAPSSCWFPSSLGDYRVSLEELTPPPPQVTPRVPSLPRMCTSPQACGWLLPRPPRPAPDWATTQTQGLGSLGDA